MSVLINRDTKVITQGMTGKTGELHNQGALDHGTQVVASVTPGKGGLTPWAYRNSTMWPRPGP